MRTISIHVSDDDHDRLVRWEETRDEGECLPVVLTVIKVAAHGGSGPMTPVRPDVASMSREDVLNEICEADADCLRDESWELAVDMNRDGNVGWSCMTDDELRAELSERRNQDGE